MGFFSSRVELNNTIKSLEAEIKKLKSETTDKSEEIAKLNEQISSLSQKNAKYEKSYVNTGMECEFCYTTLQKEFVFCPKCGKKVDETEFLKEEKPIRNIFEVEDDGGYALITRYNGFNDKQVVIPSRINGKPVIGIWNGVFEKCTDLEEVFFEEGCRYIGKDVFANCVKLNKVRLPKSLLEIGDSSFSHTAIEEIAIPPNVNEIGVNAFFACSKLTNILLPDSLRAISSGMLENTAISSVVIPNGVRHIGNSAFSNTNLTTIKLPPDLYSIKNNAFNICSLREIVIHSNVNIIENEIFGRYARPKIYCAAGSKAHLYARKHDTKCEEIAPCKKSDVNPYISGIGLNLYAGKEIKDFSEWYLTLGINKAATWSWRKGSRWTVVIGKCMDRGTARKMKESFEYRMIQAHNAHRYSDPFGTIKEVWIGEHWGTSDV